MCRSAALHSKGRRCVDLRGTIVESSSLLLRQLPYKKCSENIFVWRQIANELVRMRDKACSVHP